MSFETYELSYDKAMPIELYMFTYNGVDYTYTSALRDREIVIDGDSYTFSPAIISRGPSLKLGNNQGSQESCDITVLRNNEIATLYMGAPPEEDSVRVQIFRTHNETGNDYVRLVDGIISQVRFSESYATITVNIENVLSRSLPRGKLSYYCQNCIYDSKCQLDENAYTIKVSANKFEKLTITSTTLSAYDDGYFNGGYIKMGNAYRQVVSHVGNNITIKYPIAPRDQEGMFTICPGCDGLFATCALKYNNTPNFSGIPYIEPYNAFINPAGKGAYWIRDDVIARDTDGRVYE